MLDIDLDTLKDILEIFSNKDMEGNVIWKSFIVLLCCGLCAAKSIHLQTDDKEDLKHVLRRLENVLDSLDDILKEDAIVQVNSVENIQDEEKKTVDSLAAEDEIDDDTPVAEPGPIVDRNEDGSRPEFTSNDDWLRDQQETQRVDIEVLLNKLRTKLLGTKHGTSVDAISPEINDELRRSNKDEELLEALKLLIEMKKDLHKDQ